MNIHRSRSVCLYLALAVSLMMAGDLTAQDRTPDCTAAPYNVPAGLPTAATTAAQDQRT